MNGKSEIDRKQLVIDHKTIRVLDVQQLGKVARGMKNLTIRSWFASAFPCVLAMACSATTTGSVPTATATSAVCREGADCTHPPPPPPPPRPLGTHSIVVTSDELAKLALVLSGTILSIDTTETAPQLWGPASTYPNPAWVQCEKDLAACAREPFASRAACRADVQKNCQDVPDKITAATSEYSYLEFSPLAQAVGARNVFFPLQKIHHEGTISFDADINYVHATFTLQNFSMGFSKGSSTNSAAVRMSLTQIKSNSPTILISRSPTILISSVPDFDFTNMVAGATLDGLHPTADGLGVDYAGTTAYFNFDWDAKGAPNFAVSAFVDVKTVVGDLVSTRISQGFDKQSSHDALSKVLTDLVAGDIKKAFPNGYKKIVNIMGLGPTIRVDFIPK